MQSRDIQKKEEQIKLEQQIEKSNDDAYKAEIRRIRREKNSEPKRKIGNRAILKNKKQDEITKRN